MALFNIISQMFIKHNNVTSSLITTVLRPFGQTLRQ